MAVVVMATTFSSTVYSDQYGQQPVTPILPDDTHEWRMVGLICNAQIGKGSDGITWYWERKV